MWSAPVTLTPPAIEPVSIDEAKEFLVIEAEEVLHDQQLARFITAARQQVEAVTGTRLMPQTVRIGASEWIDVTRFPIGPVSAVTEVKWTDGSGAEQLLDLNDFQLLGQGLDRGLCGKFGKRVPQGLWRFRDSIQVTLEVGYDAVPEPVKTAILIMVADLFAQRESFAVGTVAARVPSSMQVESLLANHRIWL